MKQVLARLLIYFFNLFPMQNNKIFLFSYYGSNYGCNPKYISNYISAHDAKGKFDVVWAFNHPDDKTGLKHVRKVKTMSLAYFYELCTSKVVITNYRTTDLFVKRKNQYYIQTWHSSLRLKQIEKDAEDVLPPGYIRMAKKDSRKCDLLLSGCAYSTAIFRRAFWCDGEIFEHGTPRNDVLFQNNRMLRNNIREKLNIDQTANVLLYAPTFRNNNDLDIYQLDWTRITDTLRSKFGNDWVILVKLHPHLLHKSDQLAYGSNMMDVTAYDDIQELLLISDVLITDYSSLMFDFSITKRPCFLYIPDVKTYTGQDRKLYFDLDELPFISAMSEEMLREEIMAFDQNKYERKMTRFHKMTGSFEQGKASKHLLEHIEQVCFGKQRRETDEAI
ncbi:CDP-glycerol glycerophosphotransferase family protein [Lentibacillus sediminis]|uniref:CDP-glycerol glycerophosphotransferase family protein n=1 Tax=Lentibacillus sediminis TaxID=1940529 RepID=UPI000C1BBB7A|nr:CDP-glycerol glycerophosphotransferase family protein [Lentibacillus sediminis]